jgi:hypothetical protein
MSKDDGDLKSIEDIRTRVEESEFVMTVAMSDLRDAFGKKRIGKHVADEISRKLQQTGLGSFPKDLPLDQSAEVRLFVLGTPAADLIHAVCEPGSAGDHVIREAASGSAVETIREIRALVCED